MRIHHIHVFMTQAQTDPKSVFTATLIIPSRSKRAKKRFHFLLFNTAPRITYRVFNFNEIPFLFNNEDFNKDTSPISGKFNTVLDEITHNGEDLIQNGIKFTADGG